MIGASTRLVAIIGSPIAQVKSPHNFNSHFEKDRLDRAMIAIDLTAGQVADFVAMVRGWQNLDGFVVTIPHKNAVARLIEDLSPRARFLGAVNVVRRHPDGNLSGDMTDGAGFVDALRARGFSVKGKSALLIGAGAAGSAIAQALAETGLAELSIQDLDAMRAKMLVAKLSSAFPECHCAVATGDVRLFELVVNCSPAGMRDLDPQPVAQSIIEMMPADGLAAEVITSPEHTLFLKAAAARGLAVQTGVEMAKAQFQLLAQVMGIMDGDHYA
ncbi:shikimate dehydrogenase [Agrobacterium salinitolerans]|uniref:shikimate dehydrogenase family protein n=1 Tax=Agrobacterium salinitolerans TaxID=1183413 RepID=UPI00174E6695|nr:shikimate dehydrogenase [Agrobacterium salinitolerans]MCZ7859150.1 shikimate dehydrogenase [Agrobacterium salinitolerans]